MCGYLCDCLLAAPARSAGSRLLFLDLVADAPAARERLAAVPSPECYPSSIRRGEIRLRLAGWLQSRGWQRLAKLTRFAKLPRFAKLGALRKLRLPRWWPWSLLLLVPILLINLTVSWVGRSSVFPLSPFFLKYKLQALAAYAWHRPRCVFFDDAPLGPLLAGAEQRHRLPCGLLGAIIYVESGGKPHRISPAGAMGPLQLIPPTARALGVSDPFDPEQSLDGAGRYLRAQLASFHNIRLAVAAYNAGPGAIVHHAVPQNGQTEIYVERVLHALALERRGRCAPPRRSPPGTRR